MNLLKNKFDDQTHPTCSPYHFISNDLLVEILFNIYEENEMLKNRSNFFCLWNCFNHQKFISIIFKLCSILGIKNELVRYQTCDLFETFIFYHIKDLKKEIETFSFDKNEEEEVWANVHHQAFLRLISCLSISTKMSSFYSLLNIEVYCKLLQKLGFNYSKKAFIKSELRVLKTINYKTNQLSISSLCPILLLALAKNEPSINIESFYPTIYKVLDFFYLHKSSIFTQLFGKINANTSNNYFKFVQTKDLLFLTSVIINIVPVLLWLPEIDEIVNEISFITRIQVQDIILARDVIAKLISENELN